MMEIIDKGKNFLWLPLPHLLLCTDEQLVQRRLRHVFWPIPSDRTGVGGTLQVIVYFGRPICGQALTSCLMSLDVASVFLGNVPPSCRDLFCETHHSPLQ
ncbi:hypothetical protein XENORESO_014665 [Xenotaenia resolanae]|uniref:Uncharacterized protein n=1 Tax=Xenotaenia resolanae TaxID=208358 RepID=A0ABV0W8Q5_9TELE